MTPYCARDPSRTSGRVSLASTVNRLTPRSYLSDDATRRQVVGVVFPVQVEPRPKTRTVLS